MFWECNFWEDVGYALRTISFVSAPSSRLGTPLQATLLLCERIIYVLHRVAQSGAWERGKRLVGRASVPAASGGTDFQPVRRTSKIPVLPKIFRALFPGH
jgi:hypothetical protein